jgi:hypothetical protein
VTRCAAATPEPSGTARAGSKYWWDPGESRASTPLYEIVRLTARHRIKRVPVLDGDPLVGIVSRADILAR